MTIQEFKHELKGTDIKYDSWGETMSAWFECAGQVWKRGLPIPHEWQYSPGMGGDGTDEDNYWHEMFEAATDEQLTAIGNFLERLSNILKAKGLDY